MHARSWTGFVVAYTHEPAPHRNRPAHPLPMFTTVTNCVSVQRSAALAGRAPQNALLNMIRRTLQMLGHRQSATDNGSEVDDRAPEVHPG